MEGKPVSSVLSAIHELHLGMGIPESQTEGPRPKIILRIREHAEKPVILNTSVQHACWAQQKILEEAVILGTAGNEAHR